MDLLMENICKSFASNQVLDNAKIHVKDREIHALVGENGAGKSTLMKILTGVYQKDAGQVLIDGKVTHIKTIGDSEAHNIAIIHQELNVLPHMSIVENLFLGREIKNALGLVDTKAMEKQVETVLDSLGFHPSPSTLMGDLSVGQQQLCEISKALLMNAKLIIMDEPTAALTEKETQLLFSIINQLRDNGVSFIYISHRMEEIFTLCDSITILRDGKFIDSVAVKDTSFNDIINRMVGYDLDERFPRVETPIGEVLLSVKNFTRKGQFNDIDFNVHAGEILAFSGLMGSGRTELMHSIFGSQPKDSGQIQICGKDVVIKNPEIAKKVGIGFITEDRKKEGLVLGSSIDDNLTLCALKQMQQHGLIDNKKIKQTVETFSQKLHIRAADARAAVTNLSGGNQQKVVIAKWLVTNPKVLILDEPTRGVDVGAKREIYKIINQLKSNGVAIIVVSSELPEVIGIADRVAVMHEGRLMKILNRNELTQETIMHYAMGGKAS